MCVRTHTHTHEMAAPSHEYVMKSTLKLEEWSFISFYPLLPHLSHFQSSSPISSSLPAIAQRPAALKYLTFQNDLHPSSSFTVNHTAVLEPGLTILRSKPFFVGCLHTVCKIQWHISFNMFGPVVGGDHRRSHVYCVVG